MLSVLRHHGLLEQKEGMLSVTPTGIRFLNFIAAQNPSANNAIATNWPVVEK
jgi:hypothetical protein